MTQLLHPVHQRELPVLFQRAMVRAILAGTKTQTRREVRWRGLAPGLNLGFTGLVVDRYEGANCRPEWLLMSRRGDGAWEDRSGLTPCPYGQAGDRLWVREEHYRFGHWEPVPDVKTKGGRMKWQFVADTPDFLFEPPEAFRKGRHHRDPATPAWHKRLARFMPRAACRILLEVSAVRVERLQSISEADAIAEGIERDTGEGWMDYLAPELCGFGFPIASYASLWKSINGEGSWDANPWVWAVDFWRVKPCR
jgi:hypothetical protein